MRWIIYKLLVTIPLLLYSCSPQFINRFDQLTEKTKDTVPVETFNIEQQFRQITTHPEIDLMPSLSNDGKWILFASKRSGNLDIWARPRQGGRATQLTVHQADDIYPCWSTDGNSVVFVSAREDARGDLWQIQVKSGDDIITPSGNPRKLTDYLGLDESPAFSPNGRMIAFTSDRDGQKNIWIYHIKKKKCTQLTYWGGMNPTWSPDNQKIAFVSFRNGKKSGGDLFIIDVFDISSAFGDDAKSITSGEPLDAQPSWGPQKNEIIFTRYMYDTNRDGLINPDDQPNLWKFNLSDSTEVQLTPLGHYDYFPFYARDKSVYFISDRSGNPDVWSMGTDGPIPKQENAFLQFQFAESYFPCPDEPLIFQSEEQKFDANFLAMRLLSFQRVADYFPTDSIWVRYAQHELSRTYFQLGFNELAIKLNKSLQENQAIDLDLLGNVYWEQLRFDILQHRQDLDYLEELITQCYQLKNLFYSSPGLSARFDLMAGELYFYIDDKISALKIYEEMIKKYVDLGYYAALAQTRIAEIYFNFGQYEDVVNSFLKVIGSYPEQEKLVNSSLNKILELAKEEDLNVTIAKYRNITTKYTDYPRLAARAQLKIGELFYQLKDYETAIAELDAIRQNYPEQRTEIVQAELRLAEIFLDKNEDLLAMQQLKTVIELYEDVESGLYIVTAKERLLELYLSTGKRLRNQGDFELAYHRYQGAIKLQPGNIEAHRGLAFCLYRLGRINEGIDIYKKRLAEDPDDEVALYILGLCYSYNATEESEIKRKIEYLNYSMLKKSNETIESALSKNYRLIPAYLTLSFNYEIAEQYESDLSQKPRNFLSRFSQTITAPMVFAFRFLTFQKEKPAERWYERAIDALTTAIALNDEKENPGLEGELALNLAQNYYNLEEFGYEKAYYFYHEKLKYDTSYADIRSKAEIFKRMGHCALVTEDFKRGPIYLKKTIALYDYLDSEGQVLLNTKRLALLYQLAGQNDEAVDYFRKVLEIERKLGLWNELQKTYRSLAYNFKMLNDEEEAIRYANLAIKLIDDEKVKKVEARPNWIKIGFMGVEIPVWDLGPIGAGESTAIEGFTTAEERALLYSIIAEASFKQKNYENAIDYFQKKMQIYRQRKDKIAEAIFLNNIGYLYYLDDQYTKAWEYFERSLKICRKEDFTAGKLFNVINLGALSVLFRKMNFSDFDFTSVVLRYLNEGLDAFKSLDIGFERERAQIYILLGNLTHLQGIQTYPIVADSLESSVKNFNHYLQNADDSHNFYLKALEIAKSQSYFLEQVIVYQNLGQVNASVGEEWQAFVHLNFGRRIALENDYVDLLWRIDFALADMMRFLTFEQLKKIQATRDEDFYYREAIHILEESSVRLEEFHPTQFYDREVTNLYKHAIRYFSKKDEVYALELSERMRAKRYLDIVKSHRLQLKKERHKNYIGLARDDNRRIAELDVKIRKARLNTDTKKSELDDLLILRQKYLQEYSQLIVEMNREDPELESMVNVNPIDLIDFQALLSDNSLVVNYVSTGDSVYVWLIQRSAVRFKKLPVAETELEQQINFFLNHQINNPSTEQTKAVAKAIYNELLAPLGDIFAGYQNIIIIPDGKLTFIPFHALIGLFSKVDSPKQAITISPSLTSYYYAFQKRKIGSGKIIVAGDDSLYHSLSGLGYSATRIEGPGEKVKGKIEDSDIIHLTTEIFWNDNDPLKTKLGIRDISPLAEKDLYAYDLNANLIVINGDIFKQYPKELNFTSLNRAVLYAGVPTILYSLWPVDTASRQAFYRYFYGYLIDYPAGQALSLAKRSMIREDSSFFNWAGYQLAGFQGMTDEEKERYSLEQLDKRAELGFISFEYGDYKEAIKDYESALIMAKTLNVRGYVDILRRNIIKTAALIRNYDKAIEYQREILFEAEANQDIPGMAASYQELAVSYTESENYDQALIYQKRFIEFLESSQSSEQTAKPYHQLGLIYEKSGDYTEAIRTYGKALSAFEKLKDFAGMGLCYKDRGRVHLTHLDNYSQAIDDQLAALTSFHQVKDDVNTVEALQNAGLGYEKLADYRSALNYQNQARDLAKRIGDEKKIAISNQYIANVSWKLGEYLTALQFQEEALNQFEALGDRKFQLIGLSTQGLIRMSLGQGKESMNLQERALKLAQDLKDKKDEATIFKNMGLLFLVDRKYEDALNVFRAALAIDTQINFRRGLAYDYRDLGSLYATVQRSDSALMFLRKALVLSEEINDGHNEAQCLYEIGRTHLLSNELESASDSLQYAAEKARYLLIPDIEWRALRAQAQLHEKKGELTTSIEFYEKSIEIIEGMRSKIKVEEFQSGFIDDKLDVYGDLILLLLKMSRYDDAFHVVERAKSRSFMDLLANKDIAFGHMANDQLLTQGTAIQDEIVKIQSELSLLRSRAVPENERLRNLERQLLKLREQYSDYLVEIKKQNSELADMVSVEPRDVKEIRALLPSHHAIVEYYYTKDHIFVWLVKNDMMKAVIIPQKDSLLVDLVTHLRTSIDKQTSVNLPAQRLHQQLVFPIFEYLNEIEHLIIVPHGVLHYLPFAALMDQGGVYLIEKFSISLSPSATVLAFCLEKGQKYQTANWKRKILALGNPDLNDPAFDLPFAQKEIESVELTYPDVTSYLAHEATETVFKNESRVANMILLSCHGEFDANNPLFSALLLAKDAKNDGRLEAHEVFTQEMDAYLIAMSACETGLGAIRGGDEVIGLTRSFIYAGSASLLSSLWKVDDLATAVMMKRFFRYLKQPDKSRAEALREAQLLVKAEINSHPAYWAAFSITGDYR